MPNPAYDILQLTAMLSVRQGNDGYSPSITVKEDSEDSFVLTINNEEGSFDTPNLIPERVVKAVEKKVDKIEGKDLSTNDFTNEYKDKLESIQNYDDSAIVDRIQALQENKVDKVEGKVLSTNDFTNEYKNKLESIESYDDSAIVETIETISNRVDVLDSSITQVNSNITEINDRISKLGAVTIVDQLPEQDIRSDIIYAVQNEYYIGYTYAYGIVMPEINDSNTAQTESLFEALMNNGWTEEDMAAIDLLIYGALPMNYTINDGVIAKNYYDPNSKLYIISISGVYNKTFKNVNEISNFILSDDYLDAIQATEEDKTNWRPLIEILKSKGFKYSNEPLSDNEFGVAYLPKLTYDYYIYNGETFISINDNILVKELPYNESSTFPELLKTISFTTEEFDKILNGSKLLIRIAASENGEEIHLECIPHINTRTKLSSAETMYNVIEFRCDISFANNTESYLVIITNMNNTITTEVVQDSIVVNNKLTIESSNWVKLINTLHFVCDPFKTMGYKYFIRNISSMPNINIPNYGAILLLPYTNDVYTMQQMISGNICPYCAIFDGEGYIFAKEQPTQTITLHCTGIQ